MRRRLLVPRRCCAPCVHLVVRRASCVVHRAPTTPRCNGGRGPWPPVADPREGRVRHQDVAPRQDRCCGRQQPLRARCSMHTTSVSAVRRARLHGPGHLQGTVLHQRPQPWEPVADLDRFGDQREPGRVGEPERGGELLDRVLRDRRRPGAGQRGPVEAARPQRRRQTTGRLAGEGCGRLVGGGRVQVHPVHRQRQQPGLMRIRRPAGGDDRVQHRRRVQVAHVGCGLAVVERGAGHE
jgi:hypothetical protein